MFFYQINNISKDVIVKKDKLKLIFILILAAFLFSCSKEVKKPAEEKKPVEVKVETVQQNKK